MSDPLTILAPTRYPWRFNSARFTRHRITCRNFIPFNKVSAALEGVTIFNPFPLRRFDLVHAFNRIPLGPTPFVIGFESHLPRAFGYEESIIFKIFTRKLAGPKCRRIIAISRYAHGQFLKQHENNPSLAALQAKLEVRYPAIALPEGGDACDAETQIRLLFVGNHFARKGGCVALRIAEMAHQRGLPIHVGIVSALEMGRVSWVDPTREGYFDGARALLQSLPNITFHGTLPNDQTVALMKTANFLLLPTFSDSFGYSAIEAMANYTPVITTDQGALPEFIADGKNGILLKLEKTALGEWVHIGRDDRDTPAYETLFRDETNRLADEALAKIETIMAAPSSYADMRQAARQTAEDLFDERKASHHWDALCEQAVA